MQTTAHKARHRCHTLEEYCSSNIVVSEIQIATEKQSIHNPLRTVIANSNSLPLRLLTPTLLQNLKILSIT